MQVPDSYIALGSNSVYLPTKFDPSSKYSALILLPSCSGLNPSTAPDLHIWTSLAAERGYVTIILDSLGQRGAAKPPFNCSRNKQVPMNTLVKDLEDAHKLLSSLNYVKSDEIFAFGESMGAMTISSASRSTVPNDKRVTAGAALYGGCVYANGKKQYLFNNTSVPLLWLMGDEDYEAPVSDCIGIVKRLTKKDIGFEYHIYEGATHCWDCSGLNGFSKVAANGSRVSYKYDAEITKDSQNRVFDFFDRYRKAIPQIIKKEAKDEEKDACSDPAFASLMEDFCKK